MADVHPLRNSLRARLDIHALVPAPQVPDLVEALDLKEITRILNSAKLSGRALKKGHAFSNPKILNQSLPEPGGKDGQGDDRAPHKRMAGHRPDEVAVLAGPDDAGLVPMSYNWTRNPLTVADTLSVTLHADDLAPDLRLLRGAQVRGWLYCHEEPRRCRPGDPGYFAGVVDVVERDRNAGTVTFECRDFTIFPLNHKIKPQTLAEVDLGLTLPEITKFLIRKMPGGEKWRVEGRGKVASLAAPKSFLSEERTKLVSKRQRTVKSSMTWQEGYRLEWHKDPKSMTQHVLEGTRPVVEDPHNPAVGFTIPEVAGNMAKRKIAEEIALEKGITLKAVPAWYWGEVFEEVITPAKLRTVRIPPNAQTVFGGSEMSTWDAIVRICTLLGCVPEVATWRDGSVGIVIVSADEIQAGTILRPFQRTVDGHLLKHRVLTDGLDVFTLRERRELEAGARVDFVELHAADPDKGITRRARYGRLGLEEGIDLTDPKARKGYKRKGKRRRTHGVTQGRGTFMAVHGIVNQKHLNRLARVTWQSLMSGEFKLELTTKDPWSTGGSSNDPDLLGMAAGSALEMRFRGLEAVNDARLDRGKGRTSGAGGVGDISTVERIYKAKGVHPDAAKTLAASTLHANLPLVFQTMEVVHSADFVGDGSYECKMMVQGFIGDGETPDLDEDEWRKAQDDAFQEEQADEGGEEQYDNEDSDP